MPGPTMEHRMHKAYWRIFHWMGTAPLVLTMINYGFLRNLDSYRWTVWKLNGSYGYVTDFLVILLLSAIAHALPAFIMAEYSYFLLNRSAERNENAFNCRMWEIIGLNGIPIFLLLLHHVVYIASNSRLSGYIGFNLMPWGALFFAPYGYFAGWALWEIRSLFVKKKK